MPVKHLSHSSINTYMMCPKSWWWRYVKKAKVPVSAALPFGSAYHQTVQTYIAAKALHPDQVRPLAELWPACWAGALNKQYQKIKWDKPYDYYTKLGESMLVSDEVVFAVDAIEPLIAIWTTTTTTEKIPVVEKRIEFQVPGVSIPVMGYVDMIDANGVAIDFKTASRKWSKGKEHLDIQADFYLLGLNQEGHDLSPDNKFRYMIFTKTKNPVCQDLPTSRTWGQLFWTMELIRETWKAIEGGHFPPNVSGWKCQPKFCSYWDLCRR